MSTMRINLELNHKSLLTKLLLNLFHISCLRPLFLDNQKYKTATADFSQGNMGGIQASGVSGILLSDGNFVFFWIDGGYRKMVLTRNDGETLQAGYLDSSSNNWRDPFDWIHADYTISNFKGKL